MEIILGIAVPHPQGMDVWVGMWPPSLKQTLKSRFENSTNCPNSVTNLTEKLLVFFRKALKEVSTTLAGAISELWTECAESIKLIEQSDLARATPLLLNQPTIELFWQSPTPSTPKTSSTTVIPPNK